MQEETPLAPAQTIRSEIWVPQYFLHWVLDKSGRVACCSLLGVLASGRARGGQQPRPARPQCHLRPHTARLAGVSLVCLVRPQPVVAHSVPAGKLSLALGRHTADTVVEKRADEASFSRVMSLLMVAALYLGFLNTCGLGPKRSSCSPGRRCGAGRTVRGAWLPRRPAAPPWTVASVGCALCVPRSPRPGPAPDAVCKLCSRLPVPSGVIGVIRKGQGWRSSRALGPASVAMESPGPARQGGTWTLVALLPWRSSAPEPSPGWSPGQTPRPRPSGRYWRGSESSGFPP